MYQVAVKSRQMAKSKKALEPQANELENGRPETDEPQAYDFENDEPGNGEFQAYKSDNGGLNSTSEIGRQSPENLDHLISFPCTTLANSLHPPLTR